MEFLTAEDISKILKISYVNALSFITYSGVDYITVGRKYRVLQSKFEAFVSKKGNIQVYL